ncbi:MAG: pyrroline-5-carboxylate reductase [Pseudomonadota bacterium]
MTLDEIERRGVVMLGCGKMGSALLSGWLSKGVRAADVWILDPYPSDWVTTQGVNLNAGLPASPAVVVVAVKPQLMADALPQVTGFGGGDTLIISVAAGTQISAFEAAFGGATPIIRVMPNTPAAVGQGISALAASKAASPEHIALASSLMEAVGRVVLLEREDQMHAVTGLSGSGPAYVFHLIECLTEAGQAEGLPAELAADLALATVAGAGALAAKGEASPTTLRENVTSPNGTTQAGLEVLMAELPALARATVAAATRRSEELARHG